MATQTAASTTLGDGSSFAPLSAARIFVMGGIALILAGMIFGDVFAVFVLHQNAGRIGAELVEVSKSVAGGNAAATGAHFQNIGGLLENRGTKVDTHAHMIGFGYLALLLAVLQPYLALTDRALRRMAICFVSGAFMLPVGVFAIHYVGLAYSPLQSIGWASIIADLGGLIVLLTLAGQFVGLLKHWRQGTRSGPNLLLDDRSWSGRALLGWGTLLILAGFLHATWYAAAHLYEHERQDTVILTSILDTSAAGNTTAAAASVNDYGNLQAAKAVSIATHSHIVEFGLLAVMLAFIQPLVFLSEPWKRRWVVILLIGSVILPVFVQAELNFGLLAGGIADLGGFLVCIALTGMLVGVFRHTGWLDARTGGAR